MKTATYHTTDGKELKIEYDENAPCISCGEPVVEASMGGTVLCPWCDTGKCRYCNNLLSMDMKRRKVGKRMNALDDVLEKATPLPWTEDIAMTKLHFEYVSEDDAKVIYVAVNNVKALVEALEAQERCHVVTLAMEDSDNETLRTMASQDNSLDVRTWPEYLERLRIHADRQSTAALDALRKDLEA